MTADRSLRVQGVSLPDVSDYREILPAGKWSQFFGALDRRVTVVGISRPRLARFQEGLNLARSLRPGKSWWLAQAGFNMAHVHKLNAVLERDLSGRRDGFNLIVQLQTLCSPRSAQVQSPFVIYTDNTMALTRRHFPSQAPLTTGGARAWTDFEAEVCRQAAAVFTFSEFAARSVIEDYGCPPSRVAAIGAGANQLLPAVPQRDELPPRVLFVGHDFARKGGADLLQAWRTVRRRLPNAELIVVGPRRDPAPDFGHGLSWRGRVDRLELSRLYRSSALFVLPSMFEPWGHVFVEAMGHGLACIGTSTCAMPELIEDGVSGRLVAPGDPVGLAEAMIDLLSDPSLIAQMGRAGHARVVNGMTWDHVVDRLLTRLGTPAVASRTSS